MFIGIIPGENIIFENLISPKTMNKLTLTKTASVFIMMLFIFSSSFASNNITRTIDIAGIVFNVQTLAPVEGAQIYNADGKLLGATDKNGYYNVRIAYTKTGEMYFGLKIEKKGFQTIHQNEHWGDLASAQNVMYFGLKPSHSGGKSFSGFADNGRSDLSYTNVAAHFGKVKEQVDFNGKLDHAKAENDDVLIRIDGKLYIVDSSGWIKIDSDKDLILINDDQVLTADKLNATIKRKDIKWMSPIDSKKAKFAIHTKS
jgi:hypothetical protein